MKTALLISVLFSASLQSLHAFAMGSNLPQRSAMSWNCTGEEIMSQDATNFVLVMEDHDGKEYQYIAMTQLTFNGVSSPDIDLSKTTVECGGKTDDGQDRMGPQTWTLNEKEFLMSSGCENETIEIKAICEPQF